MKSIGCVPLRSAHILSMYANVNYCKCLDLYFPGSAPNFESWSILFAIIPPLLSVSFLVFYLTIDFQFKTSITFCWFEINVFGGTSSPSNLVITS